MSRYYIITVKRKGSFTKRPLLVLELLESDCNPDELAMEYLQELKETACETGIKAIFELEEITEKEADLMDETCAENLDSNPEYAELVARSLDSFDNFGEMEWTPECN